MSEIKIIEVNSKNELKSFIKFPNKLYKNNEFYIPALFKSELKTLTSENNPAFEYCSAKYWLAYKNNEIVGRIAGIINNKYNEKHNIKYARFGWIDFIDNEEITDALLKTVENWAEENKMEYLHGPLGFISFDASGVLVEGFDEIPTSFAHYNYQYYDEKIKACGFEKDVDWIEFNIKVPDKVPERIVKSSKIIEERYNLHNADLKNKKDILKYSEELFNLLNDSYSGVYGFSELTKKQIKNLKNDFLGFISTDYISIIINEKNELVAFGITIPSLSKALKKSNGKLFPFGFLRILKALKNNDTVDLLLIGVKKEYQNKGVHALIFNKIGNTFVKNRIKYIETTRELEENNKVKLLWTDYELRQHKKSRCYIKKL
ncbi:MAG: N-acetyltransferase [Bacteroidales bacterium]|nr:N-acetyltransferase [Bacteroidales bacterium]MBN2758430.1 N-acetyltransferase [Bacteroidales bacterium]